MWSTASFAHRGAMHVERDQRGTLLRRQSLHQVHRRHVNRLGARLRPLDTEHEPQPATRRERHRDRQHRHDAGDKQDGMYVGRNYFRIAIIGSRKT